MIIYILLFLIIVFSAIMDGEEGIARYCLKRKWVNLYLWCDSTSWENKYECQKWLLEKGFQPWFAKWMAQDVLVIFLDMWHAAKACMFLCIEAIFLSKLGLSPLEFAWCLLLTFVIVGTIFNICYYNIIKL